MGRPSTPLRMLAKTHANALISRDQYVAIRARMLKKLETRGQIDDSEFAGGEIMSIAADDQGALLLVGRKDAPLLQCLGLDHHRAGTDRLGRTGPDSVRLTVRGLRPNRRQPLRPRRQNFEDFTFRPGQV